jgi:hypothetical protein
VKAIGYVRVSTQEQAKEGVSLDNQKDRIRNYCQYKAFNLLRIIEDAGISEGKNKGRPGFMELMEAIEANGIDIVVLYSLERLSRDMLTLLALEKYLNEKNTELHTVEGQIDTSTCRSCLLIRVVDYTYARMLSSFLGGKLGTVTFSQTIPFRETSHLPSLRNRTTSLRQGLMLSASDSRDSVSRCIHSISSGDKLLLPAFGDATSLGSGEPWSQPLR